MRQTKIQSSTHDARQVAEARLAVVGHWVDVNQRLEREATIEPDGGQRLAVAAKGHALEAVEDSVVLLTVAMRT